MDARASAFEHWLALFRQVSNTQQEGDLPGDAAAIGMPNGALETAVAEETDGSGGGSGSRASASGIHSSRNRSSSHGRPGGRQLPLQGKRRDVTAVPRVLEYERGSDLELWELWAA